MIFEMNYAFADIFLLAGCLAAWLMVFNAVDRWYFQYYKKRKVKGFSEDGVIYIQFNGCTLMFDNLAEYKTFIEKNQSTYDMLLEDSAQD